MKQTSNSSLLCSMTILGGCPIFPHGFWTPNGLSVCIHFMISQRTSSGLENGWQQDQEMMTTSWECGDAWVYSPPFPHFVDIPFPFIALFLGHHLLNNIGSWWYDFEAPGSMGGYNELCPAKWTITIIMFWMRAATNKPEHNPPSSVK